MINLTPWLIACIPILSFGFLPVVATRIGGKPIDQTMGTALGSIIFALVVFFIRKPELNEHIFLFSLLSGLFWAVGSLGQYMGITYLGVSRSIPISCGTQIIFASLMGVLLGDWASPAAKIYGFSALALIIAGIVFTSYQSGPHDKRSQWGKGIGINIVSSLGFSGYVAILNYHHINGWDSLLPQSFGQAAGIILIALVFFRQLPFNIFAIKNIGSGLVWSTGNIALLLSQAALGLAVAYPIGQAAIIVSVLGGVFINGEKKNKKEWSYTLIGIGIIIAGLFLIYLSGTK
ncbi:MAG TPA: GRP family sugar transporter [Puia sp.]|nr:GRP family sugar transporter [Puia sp.]